MSLHSDDTPTGPIAARAGARAPEAQAPRGNGIRDGVAAALVIAAVFLPWNLYFGFGIPGYSITLFAVLIAVSVLSLVSVVLTHVGPWGSGGRLRLLRLTLNTPYLLLVLAFVVYDSYETIRSGVRWPPPGGVGPGAWLGVAGALLSAQPVMTGSDGAGSDDDRSFGRWLRAAQIIGYASLIGAALSCGFNLYWWIKFALQPTGGTDGSSGFGKQNIATLLTYVVYTVVAFAPVLIASRWLQRGTKASRLAASALGLSTIVAGVVVWILPVGREIDAFHGIAQNTSTAGVGFEGYLAWAAAAAIFAPRTLSGSWSAPPSDRGAWRDAARKGLLLVGLWCLGSVLLRTTDLVTAMLLDYPSSRYGTVTQGVFDLATGALAIWLRASLTRADAARRLISSLCGALATLAIARIVVGVVLAPRFADAATQPGAVYGNDLVHVVTSTFDVVLCGLALGIFVAAVITGRRVRRPARRARKVRPPAHSRTAGRPANAAPAAPPVAPAGAAPSAAATTRISTGGGGEAPTTVLSLPGSPRIFRPASSDSTRQMPIQAPAAAPKIYRRPDGS